MNTTTKPDRHHKKKQESGTTTRFKKLLALLLSFVLCISLLPSAAFAESNFMSMVVKTSENGSALTISVVDGYNNGYETAVSEDTTTLYISSLPDACVGLTDSNNEYFVTTAFPEDIPMPDDARYDEDTGVYTITLSNFIHTSGPYKGLAIISFINEEVDTLAELFIKFGNEGPQKERLEALLNSAPDSDSNTDYYVENDRYNGKTVSTNGFWADYQSEFDKAKAVSENASATQGQVDNAADNLDAAIANLIPTTQVNATELYEAVSPDWCWFFDGSKVVNREAYPGYDNWESVSEGNCTLATWTPYAKALSEGRTLLDSLYDKDGKATEDNTSDKQELVESLADAADPNQLVNAERYTEKYQTYVSRRDEANSLLELYDPDKLTENGYSQDSWKAYMEAYEALKADMDYTIIGGTKADMEMLEGFTGHITALKSARKNLTSAVDITVSFTYINHFAAKYPALRGEAGTDDYKNDILTLKVDEGTTVANAIEAAGITFIKKDLGTAGVPGEHLNLSDTNPLFAVYVNGEAYGLVYQSAMPDKPMQLHDGDEVRVVRICAPTVLVEASSGYDSTNTQEYLSVHEEDYQDSFSQIHMTVPGGTVKVGDKATFSATVTGSNATNFGADMDAENITLFVSEPGETEAFSALSVQTTAVTDQSGKLEYVFTEPGWYTVAMLNVEDDIPTFTDVFGAVTYGEYYALYAGDCALIHVEEADDEAAVMAQYRAENMAKAKAYFEQFHDYDFAEDYYEETFKACYDTLAEHLKSAENFKALQDGFDTDFTALQEAGAAAIDHAGLLAGLRADLALMPYELADMDESYADLLQQIQSIYSSMNDYQKSLLTGKEITLLEQLAAMDAEELPKLANIAVKVTVDGSLPGAIDTGAPAYGWPNLTWSMHPLPDGTVPTPKWATLNSTPAGAELTAKAGDHLFVRRYMTYTSDDKYWMMWSDDGGETWNASEQQSLGSQTSGIYDGYFLVRYVIPKDAEDGSSLNIELKMFSKAEYEKATAESDEDIKEAKEAAKAAIQAAYDSYDLSKYDDEGKAALLKALEDGYAAVDAAVTSAEATVARKTAVAAMASVAVKENETGEQPSSPTYDSGKTVGKVHVIVENTTCSVTEVNDKSTAPAFNTADAGLYGSFIDGWYDLGENDTMMTCVLKALETSGFSWEGTGGTGYGITYLSSITKEDKILAEFSGGQKSGWMGTLNDWFTNEGFNAFSVANGKLENGDEIHVMYTCDYGVDLGGDWNSADTSLKNLSVTGGTLSPSFSPSQTEYTLLISGETASVKLTPEAANKNYQTRIFLNRYNVDSALYKYTDLISVKSGDVLYVGVGESGWPTMNASGSGTRYTIKVVSGSDAAAVTDMINSIRTITYGNYKVQAVAVEAARAAFDALSTEAKTNVSAETLKKLTEAEADVQFYVEIDDAKSKLNALTSASSSSQVQAALAAYNKLSDKQKEYITKADVEKFNELAEKYSLSGITGSDEMPELEPPVITLTDESGAVTETAGTAEFDSKTGILTITPAEGYQVKEVLVNGVSRGAVTTLKNLTKDDKVTVVFAKAEGETEAEKQARIIEGVQNTKISIWSASMGAQSRGRGWIRIWYRKSAGYKVDYYEVWRSKGDKKHFGTSAFYTTKKNGLTGWYRNTKSVKKGVRYYYKVRGVRIIDGQKYYTQWSKTIYRTGI